MRLLNQWRYHRGECAERFGARFQEWLTALQQERAEANRPAQQALDLAA